MGIIGYLQVKKDFREQGLAKELYNKTLEVARNKKCNFLYLAVYAKNEHANSIYKHWGFKNTPMIYNIDFSIEKKNLIIKKPKSKRNLISKKEEVKKLIKLLNNEYYELNKVEHYFYNIYFHYSKNNVYTRRINKKDYIVILSINYEKTKIYQILMLGKGKNTLRALKEEIVEIIIEKKPIKQESLLMEI